MAIVLLGSTSGSVTLQEPAVAGTTVLSLPTSSGTFITTGSSGQSIPRAALPTGSVLQVVQTVKSDTFTTQSTTFVDLTGMSVSITPNSITNKILVNICLCFTSNIETQAYARLVQNSTAIGVGDANGSRVRMTLNEYMRQDNEVNTGSFMFLDSPATIASTIYKIQLQTQGTAGGTIFVNRPRAYDNSQNSGTGISSITLMEIAA
jgi:hypothetical protein